MVRAARSQSGSPPGEIFDEPAPAITPNHHQAPIKIYSDENKNPERFVSKV
jgi:hypothetical protein